jgi:hypothetical protein
MTAVTRSVGEVWNWTSRRVTIPRSFPYSFPVSVTSVLSSKKLKVDGVGWEGSEFDGIN